MTAAQLHLELDTETGRVVLWRTGELERAGYEAEAARVLAERGDVDLHRATELLRRGCPPETALRILL